MVDIGTVVCEELNPYAVFADFYPSMPPQSALREAITQAYRPPEAQCLPPLIEAATFDNNMRMQIEKTAASLINALRTKYTGTGVEGLIQEYSLSSQEGIALMCLAEALLRIPDAATRDALIRDKIAAGNWWSHLGGKKSLFVNAATWGLILTGKLLSPINDGNLSSILTHLIERCGKPVIRRGVDMAMRLMGGQFVTGQTIEEALQRASKMEGKGFGYSYDMLGEAAVTAADAQRYYNDYENAIHAIGKASQGRGIYAGPGVSIKLSALHPRYSRAQAERVMGELLPRVKALALIAKSYNIGLNIDAEEADRLELSLDLLEQLCLDPALDGWHGIGFVAQAYGKRCPFVIDYIIELARRTNHRIMVRLVKGAYWDAEIKRAQVDGLTDFPVFTRKVHTDISYIACARKLLGATDIIFPQFATHNAQTLATIYHMAEMLVGKPFSLGQYEFQCLHGMGEPLYEEVVGPDKLDRPCRIYAPVGSHETLLAYLVRRLLENGANASFVNRIADPSIPARELARDPAEQAKAMPLIGASHEQIALPENILGETRKNSAGLDLSDESTLLSLKEALLSTVTNQWLAEPILADAVGTGKAKSVINPGDHRDVVGQVVETSAADVVRATALAAKEGHYWAQTPVSTRADILERAAEIMQDRMPLLLGLLAREAGKSMPNAIAEVREAIDFLRYYAEQARKMIRSAYEPLGPVVCISPWNFPLAIFIGQISAALVAGNPVLAKPAEETPLIAAEGIRILYEAGVPRTALYFLPGDGQVGAALVAASETQGVMFTGSTEVARLIHMALADRLSLSGKPIPLIAETGGQNAMIVDSSALAEQVVGDVISSAFDSAGQRCSALRVLFLQEEIADKILTMLKGALHELSIGRTDKLSVDIGPVITPEAQGVIEKHIEAMRELGASIEQIQLAGDTQYGTFVPPTIIELDSLSQLTREVFGPVLHVIRYAREEIDNVIDAINATGYGLTFGLHTRIDETVTHMLSRIEAGNIYVNRNIIGAVVGVQPFGGKGLSGTGPKAGGPLYLERLVKRGVEHSYSLSHIKSDPVLRELEQWVSLKGEEDFAQMTRNIIIQNCSADEIELLGPVGERNLYMRRPRGKILIFPETKIGFLHQLIAAVATGNGVVVDSACGLERYFSDLPLHIRSRLTWSADVASSGVYAGVLIEGHKERVQLINRAVSRFPGPLLSVQAASSEGLADRSEGYCLQWLQEEISISINTAAAGGNASLMAIG